MKYQLTLPIVLLRASYLATIVEKGQESFYPQTQCDHVFITDGHILGTNGHIMFYAKLDNVPEDVKINIPVKHVKHFLEKIDDFNLHLNSSFTLEYDQEQATGFLEMPNHMNAYEGFKVFLDKFRFNWKNAIPENKEYTLDTYPQFQGAYIKRAEKIASCFGSICWPCIKPTTKKTAAFIDFLYKEVDFDINLIVMPYEADSNAGKYCVCIFDEPSDEEPSHVHPAESAEMAVKQ